jgi:gamma-glutamyltranspeptidase/glutathione hydrolase
MAFHVVAAGHELTAAAAEDVLRAGGNAFDAAVAAMAAACVTEPVLASPGGGGFLLACPASGRPAVYDFFVQTPRQRRPREELDFYPIQADFGPVTQEFHIGRGTVAVPGFVAGMFAVATELGRLPMTDLMAPAIALAREGVAISDFQAYLFSVVKPTFTATREARGIFGSREVEGELVTRGESLAQPELADTFEVLAREGVDLFYRGEIASAVARDLRDGGQLDRHDLEDYQVQRREPLRLQINGATVLTNPPPSSGGALAAFGLKLLSRDGLADLVPGSPAHAHAVALTLEATTRARVEAAAGNGALRHESLLDSDLLGRYQDEVVGRSRAFRGTTHVSIIDAMGNLASVTVSNGEGSGYVVPEAGIVMNNMLGEEDLNPGGFQRWPEAARMTSMMMPSAVGWTDGTLISCGSGGSNRIRSAVLQVLSRLIMSGEAPEAAVLAPRLHYDDGLLSIEGGFHEATVAALTDAWSKHQLWVQRNLFFGGAHTVRRGPGIADGMGDPRRAGVLRRVPS